MISTTQDLFSVLIGGSLVGSCNVLDDGCGILRFLLLFHCLCYRAEFLAYQSIRCCHHQYFLSNTISDEEKCLWGCTVCRVSPLSVSV